MKRIVKIVASLLVLSIAFILIYRLTLALNPIAIQKNTTAFLDEIQTENFDAALTRFVGGTVTNSWAQDMISLHEDGFKLISYDHVKADYDDGGFGTGHANLTFEVNGELFFKPYLCSDICITSITVHFRQIKKPVRHVNSRE